MYTRRIHTLHTQFLRSTHYIHIRTDTETNRLVEFSKAYGDMDISKKAAISNVENFYPYLAIRINIRTHIIRFYLSFSHRVRFWRSSIIEKGLIQLCCVCVRSESCQEALLTFQKLILARKQCSNVRYLVCEHKNQKFSSKC